MAQVNRNVARLVAREPGVRKAVRNKAGELAGRARGLLGAHRVTGATRIEVTSGKVDAFVSMVGEGVISIEYGHGAYMRDGRTIGASQGLYVIHRTAGLR
ncbi:DUF5403 family protein [Nonomuraea aridisoli]|uniref:HK97 gp10 family phage protein n=1 Tax=Nonomuraea aridisoli TaxID=2070368 RepID=A0A2W2EDL3_9ACTN|nr:DUF5403 family protein [Nonomuraea aridisoli]PZG20601.1 hypothetical protein C1J01_08845 [Nonomuraea aridisoli]